MSTKPALKEKKTKSAIKENVTREYTIHLHKLVHGRSFKKRAPHAIKSIRKFALQAMGTKDVRVDTGLNKQIWSRGIKKVPHRLRIRLSRRKNDEENAKEKFYTLASLAPDQKSLTKSNRNKVVTVTIQE